MAVPLTQDMVQKELDRFGLLLLGPYVDSLTPITYLCVCGGIGKTKLGNIYRQHKCPSCNENNWRETFLAAGFEIIAYHSSEKVTYKCTCGSEYTNSTVNWKYGNKYCPKCRTHWNKKEFPTPARPSLYTWKKSVLARDGFECVNCASDIRLNIHHIEAYTSRLDLVCEINNGITLCLKCHKDIHTIFGHNVGIINLEQSLGKQISFREAHYACLNTTEE